MRFLAGSFAVAVVCAAAASAVHAEDAPPANFHQNGRLNIAIAVSNTEGKSYVRAEQSGETNLFLSAQGWTVDGPFQFSGTNLPLNKLNLMQHGETNIALANQRGLNNDAVTIQIAEPGGSDGTEHHSDDSTYKDLPGGGFALNFESGEVEISAQYNIDGYRASSSIGRSH